MGSVTHNQGVTIFYWKHPVQVITVFSFMYIKLASSLTEFKLWLEVSRMSIRQVSVFGPRFCELGHKNYNVSLYIAENNDEELESPS